MFLLSPLLVNGGSSPAYQWKVNGTNVGFAVNSYDYIPSNGDVVSVVAHQQRYLSGSGNSNSYLGCNDGSGQPDTCCYLSRADPGTTVCKGSVVTFTPAPSFGGSAPVIHLVEKWRFCGYRRYLYRYPG